MARRLRAEGAVRIRGLAELQRDLRRASDKLPGELADANQEVARYVVVRATMRARRLGPMEARAATTLAAARMQRVGAVRFGGAKVPFAMGAEFGAAQNVLRNTARGGVRGWNQFRPWRGSSSGAGYFLYPTIREDRRQIVDLYEKVLDRLFTRLAG
jgi:hypothetical protein